jgi:hypothetical protein
MFTSSRSGPGNQRRSIINQITEAVVSNFETGNETSRNTAQAAADADVASTVATLVSGGYLPQRPTLAHYSLPELRRAFETAN